MKKMKFIVLMLTLVVGMFAFGACGKKAEPAPAPEPEVTEDVETPETAETTDPVAGFTFKVTSYDFGEGMKEANPEDKLSTLVFGTDGTVQDIGYDESMNEVITEGTYTVDGNTVNVTFTAEGQSTEAKFVIDGDTLTYTYEPGDGTKMISVYTKQQ